MVRAEPTPGLDPQARIGGNLLEGLFIGRSLGESVERERGDIDKTSGESGGKSEAEKKAQCYLI